ncbi:MAG: hypothetical protein GWN67_16680 [Phycisphaerae bacterium]|nr:hypothetical protein [Phycisphaerae bacterium]NIR67492.1 hypothetical protein [candidate division Zixibacteria bacterium]NIS52789.1 hypothetical protein [Phycisphaerae bacterium]NIU08245.1 hypothetical protein [Phycisphaerae bacterium]NIU57963.1 hypothetical protein [Phycisphaerae bacterium]
MNEEKIQQDDSCNDSSGSGGDCCSYGSGNWKSWRTVLFILVLLAAGALAARSVLSNGTNTPSCGAGSIGVCPLDKTCSSSKACEAPKATPDKVTCPSEKKADNPSSCCQKTDVTGCCAKTEAGGVCPKTAALGSCPKTKTPGGCPKTAAVSGCCPKTGSE